MTKILTGLFVYESISPWILDATLCLCLSMGISLHGHV
jgi:hypothetical protein